MKRGHHVNFRDLSQSAQIRELNELLNNILDMLCEMLGYGKSTRPFWFTKTVSCPAGGNVNIMYGKAFVEKPVLLAYSVKGDTVSITPMQGDENMLEGVTVGIENGGAGEIGILAIGSIKT